MKLISLTLEDFRQFRGRQTLSFAGEADRNTTLIYGPNGGGKTTILNAFIWAFYGTFTDDFEQPDRIVHGESWVRAADGDEVSASVEVVFEQDEKRYEVIRTVRGRKDRPEQHLTNSRGELRVLVTDRRGTEEPKNPSDLVDRILPERLHRFFFFNGERIENLTRHSAYKELAESTKTLLGLDVLTRAIQHLPQTARTFEKEVAKHGDSTTQELLSKRERLEHEGARLREELVAANAEATKLQDTQEAIFRELAEHSDARVFQTRRDAALRQRSDAENRDLELKRDLRRLITKSGFTAFTERIGEQVRTRFADLERNGELPTPIKEPFVRELLDRGVCICGTELTVGSSHRRELEAFVKTAGSPELESAWTRLDGLAARLSDDRVSFQADLARLLKERDEISKRVHEADEELSEVHKRLGSSDDTVVQGLEERQRGVSEQIATTQQRIGRVASDIRRIEGALDEVERDFNKRAKKDRESLEAQRCVEVAREAAAVLERVQDVLTEGVRLELNRRIAAPYDKISARRRVPELSPNFELRLYEEDTDGTRRLAPNSTGENTILALSFVGGLADYARDQHEGRIDETLKQLVEGRGGVFPVVVDAAFGNLDETYRLEVARLLPQLTTQLVMLLSKAQAEGTANKLAGHLGKRYVIVSHVAKADRDEELVVDGRAYPYRQVCDLSDERAEIIEVMT